VVLCHTVGLLLAESALLPLQPAVAVLLWCEQKSLRAHAGAAAIEYI
jgi:hypothetical protein